MHLQPVIRRHRGLILGVGLLCVVAGLAWFDPVKYAWMPKCPFRLLTGWSCPACGLQRAVHALAHGCAAEALAYNRFFVISIPYALALCWAHWGFPVRWRAPMRRALEHKRVVHAYLVLFCLWWLLRNVLGI